ncbi:MAG: mechanosensitive ion channel family protein [Armatimonadetes bacterium]|nr:mechanosensitive ion channel family protein [Armatimonadota bacterium]
MMFSWDALLIPFTDWLVTTGLRIFLVLAGTFIFVRLIVTALKRFERVLIDKAGGSGEQEKRIRTLIGLLRKIAWIGSVVVAIVIILGILDIDIRPIITAAGIGGLALGFGAQSLVRDVISGFFMLLEDQIRVGDVVVLNGTAGEVVEMNLRTTVLRDLSGTVHIFPNGNITSVSNMTKDWSRYVIDVGVAYKEDVDYVMEVLKEIGTELSADPEFGRYILKPLEVLGVDNFGPSEIVIKVMITTVPLKQWYVGRELRRRIKKRFDELGIEIPFPHTTVYWGEASRPFSMRVRYEDGRPPEKQEK